MKTLRNLVVGTVPWWVTDVSLAQNGNMMNGGNGGMWNGGWMGGYGGYWVPIPTYLNGPCSMHARRLTRLRHLITRPNRQHRRQTKGR